MKKKKRKKEHSGCKNMLLPMEISLFPGTSKVQLPLQISNYWNSRIIRAEKKKEKKEKKRKTKQMELSNINIYMH